MLRAYQGAASTNCDSITTVRAGCSLRDRFYGRFSQFVARTHFTNPTFRRKPPSLVFLTNTQTVSSYRLWDVSQRPAPAQWSSAPDQVRQRPVIVALPRGACIHAGWWLRGAACCAGGELTRDVLLLVHTLLLSIVQTQLGELHRGVHGRRLWAFFLKVRGQILHLLLDMVFGLLLVLWSVDLRQDGRPVWDGVGPQWPDLPILQPVEGGVKPVASVDPRPQLLVEGREGHVVGHDRSRRSRRICATVPEIPSVSEQEAATAGRRKETKVQGGWQQNVSRLVFPEVKHLLSESRCGSMWCHRRRRCCCCCLCHRMWPVWVSFSLLLPRQVDTQNTRRANRPQLLMWQKGRILCSNWINGVWRTTPVLLSSHSHVKSVESRGKANMRIYRQGSTRRTIQISLRAKPTALLPLKLNQQRSVKPFNSLFYLWIMSASLLCYNHVYSYTWLYIKVWVSVLLMFFFKVSKTQFWRNDKNSPPSHLQEKYSPQ